MRVTAALLVGLILGLFIETAMASRDSSGNYTLPTGTAPVAAGQTVTAARHNALANDVATELTDSLSRTGKGGMSAPLVCSVGSAANPSLTFSGDTDNGLYRETTNTPAMSAAGTKAMSWSSTTGATGFGRGAAGVGITGAGSQAGQGGTFTSDGGDALSAQATAPNRVAASLVGGPGGYGAYVLGAPDGGYGIFAAGVGAFHGIVAQGGAGAYAVAATGGAGAPAIYGVGGSGGAAGVVGTATSGSDGVQGTATTGAGVFGTATGGMGVKGSVTTGHGTYGAATSGTGAYGTATTGYGVQGISTSAGVGGYFESTGSGYAIQTGTGYIKVGGGNPAANAAGLANNVTPTNITKAWATVRTNGAIASTLTDGFNVSGVSEPGGGANTIRVTFQSAMSSDTYNTQVSALYDGTLKPVCWVLDEDTAYVDIYCETLAGSGLNPNANDWVVYVQVTGAQ